MMFTFKSRIKRLALLALPMLLPAALMGAPLVTGPVILDDQPINTTSSVKPNIVFTLDNSGSMDSTYAPEGASSNWNKYCYYNNNYNALYYNPNYNYLPPALADGSRMPNSVYTAAWKDGFHTGAGTLNLETNYAQLGTYATYMGSYGTQNRGGYYAQYNDGGATPLVKGTCYANGKYNIIDMNSATPAQKQNFANWFSYYRTRLLAMKTSAGEAFRAIGDEFRVGFMTIDGQSNNNDYGGFLKVDTFTGTHRANWYALFYRQYGAYGTPLRLAMTKVGEYFKNGTSPAGGSTPDPIQYSCQPNYHILSTDGYWNGAGGTGPGAASNWNNTLPNNPDLLAALGTEFGGTFLVGQPWPKPYREKIGSGSINTLADIAAYYWQTDIRPTLPNNVPTSSRDSASWQHVTQFTIAFSAVGTVPYPNGITSIKAGSIEWPLPVGDSQQAVDDLWSAAVVGHGQYFNVASPEELLNKLSAALQDIGGRLTSGSPSAATASDYELAGTPYMFRASYVPGEWTGHLEARNINVNAGGSLGAPIWDARTKLDARVVGSGWDSGRLIATMNTSTNVAVPFRWSNLSATQKIQLDADPIVSDKLLNYLRGDRANEDNAPASAIPAPTSTIGLFRERRSVLGSIINGAPAYQAGPNLPYADSYNAGYAAFKSSKAGRTPMIYIGASDGMLHAFKATVGDADSGEEKWAYVPGLLYKDGVDGLASWAWKTADPLPKKFSHRYRVDQTPVVTDVDFGKAGVPSGATDWRTMLVAGLNKGGKGYFALDVTNPDASTEADVASKVLWEFSGETVGDPKMGYSFGPPLVIKTRRFGWVVAVTSGYNNVAGTGHLWLLNPKTGAVLHRFDTGAGTSGVPSGLGFTDGYRESVYDNTTEQLYAVDLLGNVWRFDVSSPTAASWSTSGIKLAAIGEPITTRPAPAINPYNPSERWVVFGSGKLLGQSDVATSSVNSTLYAIKDGSGPSPSAPSTPLTKSALVQITPTTMAPEGPNVKGWYMEMANGGFGQVNFSPIVVRGVVLWGANVPTADVCTNGMSGSVFARKLGSGRNVIRSGTVISVSDGVVGLNVAKTKRTGTTTTSSQAALTVNIGNGTGGDVGNNSANMAVDLVSGRSNLRYIQVQ